MTKNEEKEIIRVVGPDYEKSDVPAYIRQRDLEASEKAFIEEQLVEAFRQEEMEAEEIAEGADSLEEIEERLEAL